MKIMLVLPKFETHIITPPLGLGYLASFLNKKGHEVIILDCVLRNIDVSEFGKILEKEKPNLVGVNAMTTYYSLSKEYISEAKRRGIITCLGGPHVSALPKQSLIETEADFVIIGEGEVSLSELAEALEKRKSFNKINGIGFKKNGKIVINPRRELIKNIDELPMPAWELMNPKDYPMAPHGAFIKKFPSTPIITTRGCPFNCSFCASKSTWMQKLRYRSSKKVVDEIEFLHKKFGVQEFHFEDDNFTSNRKHAVEVCQEIINRNLKIVWACPNGVRIDCLDSELLALMKKSGCYLLAFGIESGNQKILDSMQKHLELFKVPKILKMVKQAGIETWGFFILGLPGETETSAIETIRFARDNLFDRAQFCIFTPLPGSTAFDKFYSTNTPPKWENFNFFSVVYIEKLSEEKLKKLHKKAFTSFYLRPRIIFNLLKNLKIQQVKWLIKRAAQYHFFNKKI